MFLPFAAEDPLIPGLDNFMPSDMGDIGGSRWWGSWFTEGMDLMTPIVGVVVGGYFLTALILAGLRWARVGFGADEQERADNARWQRKFDRSQRRRLESSQRKKSEAYADDYARLGRDPDWLAEDRKAADGQ